MRKTRKTQEVVVDEEKEELTLLSLPDEPLLQVLSHLSAKDLFAAARSWPPLRALTTAHMSLWRRKLFRFIDDDQLFELLRVVPAVSELNVFCSCPGEYFNMVWGKRAEFDDRSWDKWAPFGHRELTVYNVEDVERLVSTVGAAGLVSLQITVCREDMHLSCLEDANNLETLCVTLQSKGRVTGVWPQDLVLPRLRNVNFDCESEAHLSRFSLKAMRTILQAHSGQLQCVAIESPRLLPLLDYCRPDLFNLGVVVGNGLPAGLRRMRGLRNLSVNFTHQQHAKTKEVENLLKSWPGRLEGLELIRFRPEMLSDLGAAGGLTHLRELQLEQPRHPQCRDLGPALARLPQLRSLVLLYVPHPELLESVLRGPIPALEQLVLAGEEKIYGEELTPQLPVLKDLVRRAPKPLHATARLVSEEGPPACLVLYTHPEAESNCCALCSEAKKTYRRHRMMDDTFKIVNVQVHK